MRPSTTKMCGPGGRSGRISKDLQGSGRPSLSTLPRSNAKCKLLIYVASADLCCKSSQSDASLASVEVADEGQTSSGNLTMSILSPVACQK